jgi:heptosyltransferase III
VNILVIQLRRIGDVIVTTPVVAALRQRFPDARIEFLVEAAAAPVLEGLPGLDEALVFDKREFGRWVREVRRRRYDWVLDFMNNPRTAQLALLSGAKVRAGFRVPFWDFAYTLRVARSPRPLYAVQHKFELLRALGLEPPASALPRLAVTDADFAPARDWWQSNRLPSFARRVAVMPAHRKPIRRWPARHFRDLMAGALQDAGTALVVFGGPGEEDYLREATKGFPERVFRAPVGGLRQAAALLARCDAAVTSDNGLMHLAVAVGTPTVTVYGPTWPENWNPAFAALPSDTVRQTGATASAEGKQGPGFAPKHRLVRAEGLSCLGCNRDECPYGHECLEWVSAGRVLRELDACLKETAAVGQGPDGRDRPGADVAAR